MDTAPAFQLTHPSLPDPDPEQGSLFSTCGSPMPAFVEAQALRDRVRAMLAAADVPASHRAGYLQSSVRWGLDRSAPGALAGRTGAHAARWLDLVAQLADAADSPIGPSVSDPARTRAIALQRYAQATQAWPRAAIHALQRQRSASGAFDLAMLAPLPEGLREWRHALLPVAMQCRALLYAAFAQPTQLKRGRGFRNIRVLESFSVNFDFRRRFVIVAARGPSGFTFPRYAQADLLEPLPGDEWCRCFGNRLRQELRVALGAAWTVQHIEDLAANWLTDVVKRLAERSQLLDHVRMLIRDAYPCHRQVVHDWRLCQIDRRPGRGMLSGEYTWAWRRAETLRKRVVENPQLAALWGLAVRVRHIGAEDGYDALRRQARLHGITPAGWKLLCRHRQRPLSAAHPPQSRPGDGLPRSCSLRAPAAARAMARADAIRGDARGVRAALVRR